MNTVLIDRSKEDIYDSDRVGVSVNLLRKICRENNMSWRKKVKTVKEVWKEKTRTEILRELKGGNHLVDKTKTRKADLIQKATQYNIALKT